MNAMRYALDRIVKYGIPRTILNLAFMSRYVKEQPTTYTLEAEIRNTVIQPRVYEDCNLVHGTQITIPLAQCTRLSGGYYTSVWHADKSLTQGKTIVSVLEITAAMRTLTAADWSGSNNSSGIYNSTLTSFTQFGSVYGASEQMVNSVTPVPVVSNAMVYLINENTFLIKDSVIVPATMAVRCMVENDENMNHIQAAWYPTFYDLCLTAVKSYIYNTLTVDIDSAYLQGGMELNKVKEIIDGYADAEEQYAEKLDSWYSSALLNDHESSRRFYQSISPGLN